MAQAIRIARVAGRGWFPYIGPMRAIASRLPGLLLAALALAAPAAAEDRVVEVLAYRWRVQGLLRGLGLFGIPGDGTATLTHRDVGAGRESVELHLIAEPSRDGEYFRYGSERDRASGVARRAWSSYRWRGKERSKEAAIDQAGVVDIASAILSLRRDPPRRPRQLEIWSDGRLYPVLVTPMEGGSRRRHGAEVATRRYAIRPLQLPQRRVWKGEIDLWLAADPAATPVMIHVERSLASVVLTLVE